MGACDFFTEANGVDAKDAFEAAVDCAKYMNGHGGYTGTIAEKHSFTMIEVPKGREPYEYAEELIDEDDRRVSDKWGPAGCIQLTETCFLFFGWASS
jgi:hypothetical protein